jgi:hypothetical protein
MPGSYKIINDKSILTTIELILVNRVPISGNKYAMNIPSNVINGTASLFNWKVYGLGLRGAMQGVS